MYGGCVHVGGRGLGHWFVCVRIFEYVRVAVCEGSDARVFGCLVARVYAR